MKRRHFKSCCSSTRSVSDVTPPQCCSAMPASRAKGACQVMPSVHCADAGGREISATRNQAALLGRQHAFKHRQGLFSPPLAAPPLPRGRRRQRRQRSHWCPRSAPAACSWACAREPPLAALDVQELFFFKTLVLDIVDLVAGAHREESEGHVTQGRPPGRAHALHAQPAGGGGSDRRKSEGAAGVREVRRSWRCPTHLSAVLLQSLMIWASGPAGRPAQPAVAAAPPAPRCLRGAMLSGSGWEHAERPGNGRLGAESERARTASAAAAQRSFRLRAPAGQSMPYLCCRLPGFSAAPHSHADHIESFAAGKQLPRPLHVLEPVARRPLLLLAASGRPLVWVPLGGQLQVRPARLCRRGAAG